MIGFADLRCGQTSREPGRFVVGVNLPWVGYGTDVGASAWFPDGVLSRQPEALARLDRTLEAIARDGVTAVRVFLLCDARSGGIFGLSFTSSLSC